MATITVSSKFQIVIPAGIREVLGIRQGRGSSASRTDPTPPFSQSQATRMHVGLLCLWAFLLFVYESCAASPNKVPLAFYVVSAKKMDAGKYVDTPAFPKLGYVPEVPALELRSLEAVVSVAHEGARAIADGSGRNVVPMASNEHILDIRMTPDDAKRLGVITEQAVGKRILLMLGDEPLLVARIMSSISTQNLRLHFVKEQGDDRIEEALGALVKKK